jgi:phosphoglycolate phosphatase
VIRNVVFDWSGTLCNDLPPVLAGINGVLADFGVDALSETEFREAFCLPYENFYRALLPEGADWDLDDLERRYVEHYDELENPAVEIGGAREFFDHCLTSGRRIFLLSAVKKAHFEEQAAMMGFDVAAFTEASTEIRDKCEELPLLLERHGLERSETVMIGDMVHDIDAAEAAGVRSVAVLTGYDSKERLLSTNPHVMVRDLSHLQVVMNFVEIAEE